MFLPYNGYSLYPPGNLSFIPLILFAVGLFKHDLLDMGIFNKLPRRKQRGIRITIIGDLHATSCISFLAF